MEFSIDCFIVLLKFNICQLTLNVTYDTFFRSLRTMTEASNRWNWQVNVKCMHNLKLNRRNKFSFRMYCNFRFANLIPCILQRTNYCGSAMDTFSDSTSPSMKSRIYCFFFFKTTISVTEMLFVFLLSPLVHYVYDARCLHLNITPKSTKIVWKSSPVYLTWENGKFICRISYASIGR